MSEFNLDSLTEPAAEPEPTPKSLRTLVAALVDYAGLFPPAGLSMAEAVRNYESYRAGAHAWMLGRFIVPAARLQEFAKARGTESTEPWTLSVLASADLESTLDTDLDAIEAFNDRGHDKVDSIELKAKSVSEIELASNAILDSLTTYVEVSDLGLLDAIASHGMRAKIRTGGVTEAAFPDALSVARFLAACSERGLAFKATAGLHHPLRCVKPLTYADDAPTGTMHGFVNVFAAAALLDAGMDVETASELLLDANPESLLFGDDGLYWRDYMVETESLAGTRQSLAISFGSCSFDEPVADLRELGWLS